MGTRVQWSHEIRLEARPISASRSRDFVRRHLVEHALTHLSNDVELVVSELSTNALMHAGTSFTVSLQAFEQTLLLKVEDGSSVEPSVHAVRVLGTSGRGMAIVSSLSRDWGVDVRADGGKSVWAEFSLW
jgi:anti-sigma regulatory factor (Ser/Thr protein kinase)